MGIVRLFLALSVLFVHSPAGIASLSLVPDPQLAVEGFFILSGFYIAMVYNEHYVRYANAKRYFYQARYLRLYPSYMICAALMLVSLIVKKTPYTGNNGFTYVSSWSELTYLFHHMHAVQRAYQIMANLTLIGYDWANFIAIDPHTGATHWTYLWHENARFLRRMLVPPAWSIGVELTFYLIAPWFTRCSSKLLFAVIASSCLYKYVLHKYGMVADPLKEGVALAEMGVFSLGIGMYRIYRRWRSLFDCLPFGFYVAAIMILVSTGYFFIIIPVEPHLRYALYLILLAVLIPIIFGYTRKFAWDRFIGDLSYPIYIGHSLVDYHMMGTGQYRGIYTAIGSIVLAIILVTVIERPMNRLRKTPPADDIPRPRNATGS